MTKRRLHVFALLGPAIAAIAAACSTEPELVPKSVAVSDSVVTFTALTATRKLTATVFDQNNDTLKAPVTWSSSNPGVVSVTTVRDTGVVTAVGNGIAEVRATSGSAFKVVMVTVQQMPAALVKISGDAQIGTVGQALANPLTVLLNDALGSAIANVTVSFTVAAGNGSVGSSSAVTGSNGQAATNWTLGTVSGTNHQVAASVPAGGVVPVSFTATANAGAASALVAVSQTSLRGQVSRPLNTPVTVKVTDQFANGVEGTNVTFAVTSGGGSVVTPTAASQSDGTAQTTWNLGGTTGDQTLQASAAGLSGSPITFTAMAVNSTFFVDVRFLTTVTASQRQAFIDAASRWESVITGDIGDFAWADTVGTFCVTSNPRLDETIDDVLIFAVIEPIDGPSGILGQAGPCWIRAAGFLPIIGLVRFDAADVASLEAAGQFSLVIEHEMGHVLGFGSLWDPSLFNLLADTSSADPYYTGAQGRAEFDAIGGTTYTGGRKVPVENTGGGGTRLGHWRESVFDSELMTGFINDGSNPLSSLSVAAMADEGYTVNTAAADPYTKTFTLRAALAPPGERPLLDLGDDILHIPIYVIDANGRVTRVLRR